MSTHGNKQTDLMGLFYDYNLYIPTRTLYIGRTAVETEDDCDTNHYMAENVIKSLHLLESMSTLPINIIMNNTGGEVEQGMAVYDAIKGCRSHVTMTAMGNAMSMGSIILQAADHRAMSPNAKFMIHLGEISISAHPKTAKRWVEDDEKFNEWTSDMFLEKVRKVHPRFTKRKMSQLLDHDTILGAQEALEYGFIDEIK